MNDACLIISYSYISAPWEKNWRWPAHDLKLSQIQKCLVMYVSCPRRLFATCIAGRTGPLYCMAAAWAGKKIQLRASGAGAGCRLQAGAVTECARVAGFSKAEHFMGSKDGNPWKG